MLLVKMSLELGHHLVLLRTAGELGLCLSKWAVALSLSVLCHLL